MGLKDHPGDGLGWILDLGLDLDCILAQSVDRQPSLSAVLAITMDRSGVEGVAKQGSSEEEAVVEPSPYLPNSDLTASQLTEALPLEPNQLSALDPLMEYRTKLEFALRLGFAEDLVKLVLGKLGANVMINDILEELVKLGNSAETEQEAQISFTPSSSSSSSSSSTLLSASDPHQAEAHPQPELTADNLRPIVIDGSNVAMSHGNGEVFSCRGIQLAVDWFLEHGHKDITVFVPAWRKEPSRPDARIKGQDILRKLEKEKIVVFTPSRRVQGRRVVCYDDRFTLKLAHESDAIIVSNDTYRDLANERPEWKKLIQERLLMYSFVNDMFMLPDDPLGRHGPSLENFLRKRPILPEHSKQPCPYGKKCTYGHKCKFFHPEKGLQTRSSVADELRAKWPADSTPVKSHSLPSCLTHGAPKKSPGPNTHALPCRDPEHKHRQIIKTSAGSTSACSLPLTHSHPPRDTHPKICRNLPSAHTEWPSRIGSKSDHEPRSCSIAREYRGLGDSDPCSAVNKSGVGKVPSGCSIKGSEASQDWHGGTAFTSSPEPLLEDSETQQHHCLQSPQHLHPPQNLHTHSPPPLQSCHHCPQSPPYSLSPSPQMACHSFLCSSQSVMFVHSSCHQDVQRPALPYQPLHLQLPAVGGCPNYLGNHPQNALHTQVPLGVHGLTFAHTGGASDSWLYDLHPVHRWNPLPRAESAGGWGLRQPHPSCTRHGQHICQDRPESCQWAWAQPWGHSASLPSRTAPSPVLDLGPAPSLVPDLNKLQEARKKVFVDLCNIFPFELVRQVMEKSPLSDDAQTLAATILADRSLAHY
ncbi:hypothetical protein AGOR_G00217020 [Albula goreensis]|uniref:C3H1-type domain-containing protein n=1 Tax=Albula goreensis TaxID=1534307 RepID=A0A8T3CMS5_9TELE|nr:hypothetical protein AGOR_G00217020 [Albula goreensis]